jgi:probable HAF family extracellular repeat protein
MEHQSTWAASAPEPRSVRRLRRNYLGQIVGGANTPGNKTIHAFLWTKERGMRDLGTVGNDVASIPGGTGGKSITRDKWLGSRAMPIR